ncbi:MAG: ribosome biogenesis GTPase Der [Candidatus Magasanikbacteria bacterium]|nr:ribosome biogenesis GTPase Der [Candidatus Magasanikbacteria bacterium]
MTSPAKIIDQELPTIALVGRVNVGKSSLFNKIIEQNLALVSDIPGTTRTRNMAVATWRGKNFRLVDTGGLTFSDDVVLEDDIIKQTELALKEADLILFVADIQTGILPQERELAKRLRNKRKPILLVANKADAAALFSHIHDTEWQRLGFGEPIPVSASNGTNVGDLLDAIYSSLNKLPRRPKKLKIFNPIKVAIMGRPNVGKSTLFNALVGEERVIVNPMAHTTREPHDTLVEIDDKHILFVDTAGIRRKARVSGELEKLGIGKSIATINKSDIVLLVLDATEPISDQDQQLAGLLREHTRSVIIVVNKWDKADDNSDEFRNNVKKDIYVAFPHLSFAPIVFVSALSQYRVHQIFPLINQAWAGRQIVVDEVTLTDFLKRTVKKHLPTKDRGVRHPRVVAIHQLGYNPPMFEMIIKSNTSLHISYVHFIERHLREEFGFFASPIVMKLSKLKHHTYTPQE